MMRLMCSLILVFLIGTPLLADYYFVIYLQGSNYTGPPQTQCYDYGAGLVFNIWCQAQGTCYPSLHDDLTYVDVIAECGTVPCFADVNSSGNSSFLDSNAHGLRDDDVYFFNYDRMCTCENGCVSWSEGTNPFPC
jgi:hypothetical protein